MTINFAITGCGGYIAPRHLQAIKDIGGDLVAATDPNDSVGILDRYFKDVSFFTDFERFQDYLCRRFVDSNEHLDYVAICSPNHLHAAHIAAALRLGANAICEKPLVLHKEDLDYIASLEQKTGKKIFNVLQLRILPTLVELKQKIDRNQDVVDVELSYITSRGPWYSESWKGNEAKSGGVATNIGIHFFDLMMWYFGKPLKKEMHLSRADKMSGYIELERARVKWFLSTDHRDLPEVARKAGKPAFRSLTMNGQEIEFSEGFTDLHTVLYKDIVYNNNGFGLELARAAIELVSDIRSIAVDINSKNRHPLLRR